MKNEESEVTFFCWGKREKERVKSEKWEIALTQFCLEDSTERSESNPGRSLGMDKEMIDGCLEDSTKEK